MSHYDAAFWIIIFVSLAMAFAGGVLFGLNHYFEKLMRSWEELARLRAELMKKRDREFDQAMEDKIARL